MCYCTVCQTYLQRDFRLLHALPLTLVMFCNPFVQLSVGFLQLNIHIQYAKQVSTKQGLACHIYITHQSCVCEQQVQSKFNPVDALTIDRLFDHCTSVETSKQFCCFQTTHNLCKRQVALGRNSLSLPKQICTLTSERLVKLRLFYMLIFYEMAFLTVNY